MKLDPSEEHFYIGGPRAGLRLFLQRMPARNTIGRTGLPVVYVHGATFPSALSVAYRFDGRSCPAEEALPLCMARDAADQLLEGSIHPRSRGSCAPVGHIAFVGIDARGRARRPSSHDEKSVVRWRTVARHHEVQTRGLWYSTPASRGLWTLMSLPASIHAESWLSFRGGPQRRQKRGHRAPLPASRAYVTESCGSCATMACSIAEKPHNITRRRSDERANSENVDLDRRVCR